MPSSMGGRRKASRAPISLLLASVCISLCAIAVSAQQASSPQPLNANVSDFGTTFVFSPPPVCPGCLETELGFQSIEDARFIPAIATWALPSGHTDLSVLVNLLDSESSQRDRLTQFGNRFDFVVRQQILTRGGFELTLAPRGAIYVRGTDGGRLGAVLAPQYSWGNNLAILNLTWTAGISISPANPRSDYLTSFDYYRTLQKRGTALFLGFQQELAAGVESANLEEGLVIPFRDGQVELEAGQLNLNTGFAAQFQARIIVNWGKLLKRQ